jgi:uncharacterized protein (DUF58 family)
VARRDPNKTFIRYRPSFDFSLTGLIYCCIMMFMALAAMNSQANLLFGVFGLMIGVLLISGSISRLVLKRLEVRRVLPDMGVVGRKCAIVYEFVNKKRFWPSLSVSMGELDGCEGFVKQPFTYMLHAAAKMTARVPTEVVPKRRGLHTFDRYQIGTSFPFGFIKRAITRRRKDALLVCPALGQVDSKLLKLCQSADKSGAVMRPKRGGLDEFYGLKEYRQGENPRWIYWKRSAKTGVLVSREMTQAAPPKLMLLVDTYLPEAAPQGYADVERTIAMAASLADHALDAGMAVGLHVWGGQEGWVTLAPNRGKRHTRDVLAALAQLPRNVSQSPKMLLADSREFLKGGATPVIFTPRDITIGRTEAGRGGMLVLSATSRDASRWFRFDPNIDFARTMPLEEGQKTIDRRRRAEARWWRRMLRKKKTDEGGRVDSAAADLMTSSRSIVPDSAGAGTMN